MINAHDCVTDNFFLVETGSASVGSVTRIAFGNVRRTTNAFLSLQCTRKDDCPSCERSTSVNCSASVILSTCLSSVQPLRAAGFCVAGLLSTGLSMCRAGQQNDRTHT